MFSPRTQRKIDIENRLLPYLELMNSLGVNFRQVLGCSTQGCAYTAGFGRIAKITQDWDEIRLAQWTKLYQAEGGAFKGLPEIYLVKFLEPSLFLIIREDLSDLHFDNQDWFDDNIADKVYEYYRAFVTEHNEGITYTKAFLRFKQNIKNLFNYVTQRAENADYDDVWADDIDKVYAIQECVEWLLDHNILICDVISDNWGLRADGTVVIRDLGCNTAPIMDASLFLPYPPRPNPDEQFREVHRQFTTDPSQKEKYLISLLRQGLPLGESFVDADTQTVAAKLASLPFIRIEDANVENYAVDVGDPLRRYPGLYVAGLRKFADLALRMKYKLKAIPSTWQGQQLPLPGNRRSFNLNLDITVVYLLGERPLYNITIERPARKFAGWKRVVKALEKELKPLFSIYQKSHYTALDKLLADSPSEIELSPNEERLVAAISEGIPAEKAVTLIAPHAQSWPRLRARYTLTPEILAARIISEISRSSPRLFGW